MKIVWSPTARARAIQAMEFMERERPVAALEWLEGLVRRVGLLAQRPYCVIYTVRSDHLEILTLRHFRERRDEE